MSATETFGPAVALDGPPPVAPLYSLLTVASLLSDAIDEQGNIDPHWLAGIALRSYPPGVPSGFDPCADGSLREKDEGETIPLPVFAGFTAYVATLCSAFAIGDWDDFKRRANIVMAATDSFAAERQLMAGDPIGTNPFLADTNADFILAGVAQKPTEGLALLEDAIGETGRGGVIHATPATVTAWDATGVELVTQNGVLMTRGHGTPIAVGDGYIGNTQPVLGAAPTSHQAWAYATGPIQYGRSLQIEELPAMLSEALNRSDNSVIYRAERDLLVEWDTALQAAVLIDRSL